MEDKTKLFKWTGIAFIIIVIVIAGFKYAGSRKSKVDDKKVESSLLVLGSTTPLYVGENVLSYQFVLPKTLTNLFEDGGRTIFVNDATDGTQKSFIYLSNQEYKGSSAEQYFDEIILPTLTVTPLIRDTVMVNNIPWYHVETNTLAWDIASFKDDKWLAVIKYSKGNEEIVSGVRQSFDGK